MKWEIEELRAVAQELNVVLGLEPPLDLALDEIHLIDELLDVKAMIKPTDRISGKAMILLENLTEEDAQIPIEEEEVILSVIETQKRETDATITDVSKKTQKTQKSKAVVKRTQDTKATQSAVKAKKNTIVKKDEVQKKSAVKSNIDDKVHTDDVIRDAIKLYCQCNISKLNIKIQLRKQYLSFKPTTINNIVTNIFKYIPMYLESKTHGNK